MEDDWEEVFSQDVDILEEQISEAELEGLTDNHLEVLRKNFGHSKFRPLQWRIIRSIIEEKRDNLAVMSTGYGKSLCFQYPSVFCQGVTIVMCPLIALMEDQVRALKLSNINACYLGSAQVASAEVKEDILKNRYNLVYLTPEFATGSTGQALLKNMYCKLNIVLIAVDEAHCVSTWGHDFRPHYKQIGFFKEIMPSVPILAVTATATDRVQNDIAETLKLKNPQLTYSGYDRSNLYFAVMNKTTQTNDFSLLRKENILRHNCPTIIYTISRKSTEEISELITGMFGIPSLPYHAKLNMDVRKATHEKFVKDEVSIIVATIAYGMGIDKPDIRVVIHYGAPSSIENYYQEVGRAGRDGGLSKCIMFYCQNDFNVHEHLRKENKTSAANLEEKQKMADKCLEYIKSRQCRREYILEYLQDKKPKNPNQQFGCCDNCLRNKNTVPDHLLYVGIDDKGLYDFTKDVVTFLKVVKSIRYKYGLHTYVLFLRGSQSEKIRKLSNNSLHGSGRHKSEAWWKAIGQMLIADKFLIKVEVGEYLWATYVISEKGERFLEDIINEPCLKYIKKPTNDFLLLLKKQTEPSTSTPVARSLSPNYLDNTNKSNENKDLKSEHLQIYRILMDKRSDLATLFNIMPYTIASNKALIDMAKLKPQTLDGLKNLEGFSELKIKQYGNEFLNIIKLFNKDVVKEEGKKESIRNILIKHPLLQGNFSMAMCRTNSYYSKGLTVKEIADERGLKTFTVISHLVSAMRLGYPIKMIDLGVKEDVRDQLLHIMKNKTELPTISEIKEVCPDEITYDEVKIVRAYYEVRKHLKDLNIPYEEFEDFDFDDVISRNLIKSNDNATENENSHQNKRIKLSSGTHKDNIRSLLDSSLTSDDIGNLGATRNILDSSEILTSVDPVRVTCLYGHTSNFQENVHEALTQKIEVNRDFQEASTQIINLDKNYENVDSTNSRNSSANETSTINVISLLDSPPHIQMSSQLIDNSLDDGYDESELIKACELVENML